MTHQNHKKVPATAGRLWTGLAGAAVLTLGMLMPFAAQAGHNDRAGLTVNVGVVPVGHSYRDSRHHARYDRRDRQGNHSAYFVRPFKPLNFKHWWRVERRLQQYTPQLGHLNRYEVRQVLGHSYDRYLRDHRRWSKRAQRRHAHRAHRADQRRYDNRRYDDRRYDNRRHKQRDRDRSRW